MLSLKFAFNSARNVVALTSSQSHCNIISALTTSAPSNQRLPNCGLLYQPVTNLPNRSIFIGNVVEAAHVTTVATRAQKINAALMEAEIDLPVKPKKPITPWVAFVRDRKDDVLSQNKGMTAAQMAVLLSREWRNMNRSQYESDYNRRRDNYLKQVEEYKNSLTEQHHEYLAVKKNLTRETKALKTIRKLKPPKLPRSAANLFTQLRCNSPEIREQLKTRKSNEVFSDIFKEYRELSDEEKEKYLMMQQNDKIRFKNEFLEWYESVKNNRNITLAAREQADIMYARFKALGYV